MNYRRLGRVSNHVSEVSIGTSQIANVDGRHARGKPLTRRQADAVIGSAIDRGVNLFDTADLYGDAEIVLGELPPSAKAGLIIATKAGLREDGERDFAPAYLQSRAERSLRRLKVERIQLFQLNKPSGTQLTPAVLDEIESLKATGKIEFAGLIVSDMHSALEVLDTGVIDCIQVFYNLLHVEMEPLIAQAARAGVGVLVRSPLNSGLLSGTYDETISFPPEDDRALFFQGPAFNRRLAALRDIQERLNVGNDRLLEFALGYVLSNEAVSAILVGASNVDQVERYAACSGQTSVPDAERISIRDCVSRAMAGVDTATQFTEKAPIWSRPVG